MKTLETLEKLKISIKNLDQEELNDYKKQHCYIAFTLDGLFIEYNHNTYSNTLVYQLNNQTTKEDMIEYFIDEFEM
jgi:hypothetical protein